MAAEAKPAEKSFLNSDKITSFSPGGWANTAEHPELGSDSKPLFGNALLQQTLL
jgi:hypothetical protein